MCVLVTDTPQKATVACVMPTACWVSGPYVSGSAAAVAVEPILRAARLGSHVTGLALQVGLVAATLPYRVPHDPYLDHGVPSALTLLAAHP